MKTAAILAICFLAADCNFTNQAKMNTAPAIVKTLYLARHAKSSWKDASLADFDRPLKKRGKNDAPLIGKVLADKGVLPGLIISSPAKRAIATARILAGEMGYPEKNIAENETIYEASVTGLLEIIEGLNDSLQSVMLVGHNPSFTSLANYLADKYFDNVPTTGVVAIGFPFSSWKEVDRNTGKVLFFEYPKKYKNGE